MYLFTRMTPRESNYKYTFNFEIIDINYFSVLTKLNVMFYSRITLKSIQCDWDEFFVASVITASKENLYQSHIAITSRFYFELTILIAYKLKNGF